LLIVVVSVYIRIIVVQFAVPGVITIVLSRRPKVGVVAHIIEITIVVAPPARPRAKATTELIIFSFSENMN